MTDIELDEYEGLCLKKERTPEFFKTARKLSDFIHALPLDTPTNDRLVKMMIEHVEEAEAGALAQGLKMGMDFAIWDAAHPEEAQASTVNLPS